MTIRIPRVLILLISLALAGAAGAAVVLLLDREDQDQPDASSAPNELAEANALCTRIINPKGRPVVRLPSSAGPVPADELREEAAALNAAADALNGFSNPAALRTASDLREVALKAELAARTGDLEDFGATVSEAVADAFEKQKALPKEGSLVVLREVAGARFVPRYHPTRIRETSRHPS